ncbi:type II secretion system secretin GspD [Novosphingobium pituita]|uniref:Type II secretion system secretin GspD n=1 Tax=Novosphingobium pituita TaxID=3056842 RepID=A0ABQ6P974_9SPHN|nr:type II secretion system secretin GspD [Novosphingobium sp. IK01]GMM60671.1 type II secretion system secretin GspD [Novosphingobium sp. IK01]
MTGVLASMRWVWSWVGLVALALPAPAFAQYRLNVREADVRAFIADAAEVTGRTFIVDARVTGKVSVASERVLSASEYFEVFLATLRANGLVAVPTGNGAFRIQPMEGAATQPTARGISARNQMVTEVIRLRVIDVAQALEALRPLVGKDGALTANRTGNSLVVVDYADNVARLRALARQLDQDRASFLTIDLAHLGAREMATALGQLIASGEGGRAMATVVPVESANAVALRGEPTVLAGLAQIARRLDAQAGGTGAGGAIRVLWLEHADAALLVPVLERLAGGSGGEASAGSAAPVSLGGVNGGGLAGTSMVGSAGTGGMAGPGMGAGPFGNPALSNPALSNPSGGTTGSLGSGPIRLDGGRGSVTITRYPGANAVIIAGPADEQRRLADLVRALDRPQRQVLVEAIVVEVSDDVARRLGVQMMIGGKNQPFAVTSFSNGAANILDLAGGLYADRLDQTTTVINGSTVTTSTNSTLGDSLRSNAAQAALAARGGIAGWATALGGTGFFGALIDAIHSDSNSNVLSTPHIVTNDNVPASILFGKEIPVATGEALSGSLAGAFRTIQRQNVGIELDVTPQINGGSAGFDGGEGDAGAVRLDLRQQVSSVAGPVSSTNGELVVNKREIRTTVTVGDGEIVALGGLLDDAERRTLEKIPVLGDMPVLGELFRSRSKTHVKTNLMVFIRPTILRGGLDRAALTARRMASVRGAQVRFAPGRDPSIDELVADYLGPAHADLAHAGSPAPGDVLIAPPSAASPVPLAPGLAPGLAPPLPEEKRP